jgi:hypothetical protein
LRLGKCPVLFQTIITASGAFCRGATGQFDCPSMDGVV